MRSEFTQLFSEEFERTEYRLKKLAVIGAGEAAIPILNKAKEIGVFTVAFGEQNSLAKDLADKFYAVSIFERSKICDICKKECVDGVIASSEVTTESTAYIAEELGLLGNCVENGFAARNKLRMRHRVSQYTNVKQPEYHLFQGVMKQEFPVMVKSIDACGKKGITLVRNQSELQSALHYAQENSSNGEVLIEEYIEGGKEYSIECIASKGRCFVIQITEKENSGPPHFVEIAHHQPAKLDEEIQHQIIENTGQILAALGITNSMAHVEIKVKDGSVLFIEAGARAGGDHIADVLVGLSTDFDYYKAAILCCFGDLEKVEVRHTNYSGIYFYCKQNAHLKELFAQAKNADWCVQYNILQDNMLEAYSNTDTSMLGSFIYSANHKIGACDINALEPVILNKYPNAFSLLWNHNKEIGRQLSDKDLESGIHKFLEHGNAITILDGTHVVAFANLYCNNYEQLQAYICNVFVLPEYRGRKLSKKLLLKAIEITQKNCYRSIRLHVAKDNYIAIELYRKFGFKNTGESVHDGESMWEMTLYLD